MSCKNVSNSILDSSNCLSNNHGTIDSKHNSTTDTNEYEFRTRDKRCISISTPNDDIPLTSLSIPIYRFKFTQDFMEELHKFSKIHYLDNRKDFKEAWVIWSEEEEKKDLIEKEIKRLNDLGFHGDILDKMFKSARYYFRKREDINTSKEVFTENSQRHYHCCSKYLLEIMDKQIKNLLLEKDKESKPSIAFLHFCKENRDLLKEEIESLFKSGFTDVKEIQNKIKKTYKNKYFSIIHK
jgi:hypothetical protein